MRRRLNVARADWELARLGGLDVWQSRVLSERCGLPHAFTGIGGNLSRFSGADAADSVDRRRRLCAALGLDPAKLVCGAQIHGASVALVDAAFLNDRDADQAVPETDGLVTRLAGAPLLALSADCPLIVLYDASVPALGIAHSGWRGTVANMPGTLVRALTEQCDADPGRCIAVVSPCAGGRAYEIRDDVREQVEHATSNAEPFINRAGDRMYLDLPQLIAAQLASAGIHETAIHLPEQCSISDKRFYSYRRDGANAGHAGLIVGMKLSEPRP